LFFPLKYNKIKTWLHNVIPASRRLEELNWHKLIVKYLIAGFLSTLTHLLVLHFVHTVFYLNIIASTTVAFIAAFLVSFSLQKFWTFRNLSRKYLQQIYLYLSIGIFNLFVNGLLMEITVNWWAWHYLWAQIATSALIAVSSFILYKFIVFKK